MPAIIASNQEVALRRDPSCACADAEIGLRPIMGAILESWLSRLAPGSAFTRLRTGSAPVGWARCTARGIRCWTATSLSRFAHIYGIETTNGARAIVMELVPGEDLRERLTRGAMPIDEVLPVARQNRRGARSCTRQRHRSPRPEASQHQDPGRTAPSRCSTSVWRSSRPETGRSP